MKSCFSVWLGKSDGNGLRGILFADDMMEITEFHREKLRSTTIIFIYFLLSGFLLLPNTTSPPPPCPTFSISPRYSKILSVVSFKEHLPMKIFFVNIFALPSGPYSFIVETV